MSDILFTPQEAAQLGLMEVQRCMTDKGWLTMGFKEIDDWLIPGRPGDLWVVIGRPANGKSMFMEWLAQQVAWRIVNDGYEDSACVIYASWEQSVEDMAMGELAREANMSVGSIARGDVNEAQFMMLQALAAKRSAMPLYRIGHSVAKRGKRPGLSLDDIEVAMYGLESGQVVDRPIKPVLIVMDYLQLIRASDSEQGLTDRMRFVNYVYRCKDLALGTGSVVLLGCQARREVDDRAVPIPNMRDGAETAAIEHAGDAIFTVHMPKTTFVEGTELSQYPDTVSHMVSDEMMILSLAKRKKGAAGKLWLIETDPGQNRLVRVVKGDIRQPDMPRRTSLQSG